MLGGNCVIPGPPGAGEFDREPEREPEREAEREPPVCWLLLMLKARSYHLSVSDE